MWQTALLVSIPTAVDKLLSVFLPELHSPRIDGRFVTRLVLFIDVRLIVTKVVVVVVVTVETIYSAYCAGSRAT